MINASRAGSLPVDEATSTSWFICSPGKPRRLDGNRRGLATFAEGFAAADDTLPKVAQQVLVTLLITAAERNSVEDALWALGDHPPIPKRVRREISRALGHDQLVHHGGKLKHPNPLPLCAPQGPCEAGVHDRSHGPRCG